MKARFGSDNPEVATVTDDGLVTAHKPGCVEIYIETEGDTTDLPIIVTWRGPDPEDQG